MFSADPCKETCAPLPGGAAFDAATVLVTLPYFGGRGLPLLCVRHAEHGLAG